MKKIPRSIISEGIIETKSTRVRVATGDQFVKKMEANNGSPRAVKYIDMKKFIIAG
jgi:hypothetical protein